jgi:hypothetical protein
MDSSQQQQQQGTVGPVAGADAPGNPAASGSGSGSGDTVPTRDQVVGAASSAGFGRVYFIVLLLVYLWSQDSAAYQWVFWLVLAAYLIVLAYEYGTWGCELAAAAKHPEARPTWVQVSWDAIGRIAEAIIYLAMHTPLPGGSRAAVAKRRQQQLILAQAAELADVPPSDTPHPGHKQEEDLHAPDMDE